MAPRTVYANLPDGLQPLSLFDQSLADMGNLGMIPCTAVGTNAIVLTPIASAFAPTISNPPQQLQNFTFVAVATSTGAVTINGLKAYKEDGATQAAAGDFAVNVLYGVAYNSALNSNAGGYQITFPITSILNPVISGATISNSTITTSTYNGNTWTAGTGILTIAALKTLTASNTLTFAGVDGKTLTVNNSLTLAGTDGTTMTFPTTSATLARTDASNTFTGHQTIEGVTSTGATGTGNLVFSTSPTLTTPILGAATATTINGNTFTTGTYTLTGTAAKTLNFTNSLTLSGTDATTMTFPTTSATIARTDAAQTFTGTQTLASLTASSAVATDGSKNLVSVTNTGSGNNVLATSPTLTTPNIGAATATTVTFSPTTGGIVGTTTNDNTNAGNVGEYVESVIPTGSAVSLTTNTGKTITSISLTAGDWDVAGSISFNLAATTNITNVQASISLTTNTMDTTNGRESGYAMAPFVPTSGNDFQVPIQPCRFSLSTTTTVFLVAFSTFTVSTCTAFGIIRARRVR